jgi:uncharacterized protein (TIGR00369 family)
MDIDPGAIAERLRGTLAELLGIRFVEVGADRVVAELPFRVVLTTAGGSLHGGTLMALADTVGATATMLNLPPGAATTTIESKTNFIAAARAGTMRAEATPLHRGKRTMVWQTRITDEGGAPRGPHHPDADGPALSGVERPSRQRSKPEPGVRYHAGARAASQRAPRRLPGTSSGGAAPVG